MDLTLLQLSLVTNGRALATTSPMMPSAVQALLEGRAAWFLTVKAGRGDPAPIAPGPTAQPAAGP